MTMRVNPNPGPTARPPATPREDPGSRRVDAGSQPSSTERPGLNDLYADAKDRLDKRAQNALDGARGTRQERLIRLQAARAQEALEARFQNALTGGADPGPDAGTFPVSLALPDGDGQGPPVLRLLRQNYAAALDRLEERARNALDGAASRDERGLLLRKLDQAREALEQRFQAAVDASRTDPA